jgi:hypothetical protein
MSHSIVSILNGNQSINIQFTLHPNGSKLIQPLEEKLNHCSEISPIDPNLIRLKSIGFWDELLVKSNYDSNVEALYEKWQLLERLAHLSSKQLLSLLRNEIDLLRIAYPIYKEDGFYAEKQTSIEDNCQKLNLLTYEIYMGLNYRSTIYLTLKADPQVDDVVAAICHDINELGYIDPPFILPDKPTATLSYDRRIEFAELFSQKATIKKILAPVPNKGIAPFRDSALRKQGLKQHAENIQKLLPEEKRKHLGDNLWKSMPSFIHRGASASVDLWGWTGLGWISSMLQKYRYLIYLGLSLAFCYLISINIFPIMLPFIGAYGVALTNSVMFFTMGFAPLWVLGYDYGRYFYQKAIRYFSQPHHHAVLDAIIALDHAQTNMEVYLSQTIIDVANFDCEEFISTINSSLDDCDHHQDEIKTTWWYKTFFETPEMRSQCLLLSTNMEALKAQLKSLTLKMTKHVTDRIEKDIIRLTSDKPTEDLYPVVSPQNVERLGKFVDQYGSSTTKAEFRQKTDMVNRWSNHLRSFLLPAECQVNAVRELKFPWGQFEVNKPSINGWKALLNAYQSDPNKTAACLELNELLLGHKSMGMKQLNTLIDILDLGDKRGPVLENIQTHLFLTLNNDRPQNAALLSNDHKKLIAEWYEGHQEAIETAEAVFEAELSSPGASATQREQDLATKALAQYYPLLDGAEIYHSTLEKSHPCHKKMNSIKAYYKSYTGDSSLAYRLIRFVPEVERAALMVQIGRKRFDWILSHTPPSLEPRSMFEFDDELLFRHYRILETDRVVGTFMLTTSQNGVSRHAKKPYKNQYQM